MFEYVLVDRIFSPFHIRNWVKPRRTHGPRTSVRLSNTYLVRGMSSSKRFDQSFDSPRVFSFYCTSRDWLTGVPPCLGLPMSVSLFQLPSYSNCTCYVFQFVDLHVLIPTEQILLYIIPPELINSYSRSEPPYSYTPEWVVSDNVQTFLSFSDTVLVPT